MKKMPRRYRSMTVGWLIVVSCIIVALVGGNQFNFENMAIDDSSVALFGDDWSITGTDGVTQNVDLPAFVQEEKGSVILEKSISESHAGETLSFFSQHERVSVYFGDLLKYDFGTRDLKSFGKSPGSAWHFISIPEELRDGKVKIILSDPYEKNRMVVQQMYIGAKDSCAWMVYKKNMVCIFLAGLVLLCALIIFAIFLLLRTAKVPIFGLEYLSLSFLFAFFYILAEGGGLQFFYGNQHMYQIWEVISIMILSILVPEFFRRCYFEQDKKQFDILISVLCIGIIMSLVFHLANIYDFEQQRSIIGVVITFSVLYMIYRFICLFKKMIKPLEAGVVLGVNTCLMLAHFGDVWRRENIPSEDYSFCFRTTLVIWAFSLTVVFVHKASVIFFDSVRCQNDFLCKKQLQKDEVHPIETKMGYENEMLDDCETVLKWSNDLFQKQWANQAGIYVEIIIDGLKEKQLYKDDLDNVYEDASVIYKAAPLYDIGKITVPDYILSKPGKLSEQEFDEIKTHTTASDRILEACLAGLENSAYIAVAKDMAIFHHERYDGTGYPFGLRGEEIPLCARIMAIADVFDALISKRSYKEPMSVEQAFLVIKRGSGSHFDPIITEIFLERQQLIKQAVLSQ